MSKLVNFLMIMFVATLIISCDNDEDATLYNVNVVVTYEQDYGGSLDGITVKVENASGSFSQELQTDAQGKVIFNLESGEYNFSSSTSNEDFSFSVTKSNVSITEDININLVLSPISYLKGGLIFSQVYYSSSKTPQNKPYMVDEFIEIYNNSNKPVYLDKVAVGILRPSSSKPSVWVNNDGTLMDKIPLNMMVIRFPGAGKDISLEPYHSVVVASDAINHKEVNSNSPVDLSKADYEIYIGDFNNGIDADVPSVTNMDIPFYNAGAKFKEYMISPTGAHAIVLFEFPENVNPKDYCENPDNLSKEPGSSYTKEYLLIPKEWVIDGIEIVSASPKKRHKRLHEEIDAGKIWCSASYNGKSIRRKVKAIIDNNLIYLDTNNSSNDFLADQEPIPWFSTDKID